MPKPMITGYSIGQPIRIKKGYNEWWQKSVGSGFASMFADGSYALVSRINRATSMVQVHRGPCGASIPFEFAEPVASPAQLHRMARGILRRIFNAKHSDDLQYDLDIIREEMGVLEHELKRRAESVR